MDETWVLNKFIKTKTRKLNLKSEQKKKKEQPQKLYTSKILKGMDILVVYMVYPIEYESVGLF